MKKRGSSGHKQPNRPSEVGKVANKTILKKKFKNYKRVNDISVQKIKQLQGNSKFITLILVKRCGTASSIYLKKNS